MYHLLTTELEHELARWSADGPPEAEYNETVRQMVGREMRGPYAGNLARPEQHLHAALYGPAQDAMHRCEVTIADARELFELLLGYLPDPTDPANLIPDEVDGGTVAVDASDADLLLDLARRWLRANGRRTGRTGGGV